MTTKKTVLRRKVQVLMILKVMKSSFLTRLLIQRLEKLKHKTVRVLLLEYSAMNNETILFFVIVKIELLKKKMSLNVKHVSHGFTKNVGVIM